MEHYCGGEVGINSPSFESRIRNVKVGNSWVN